MDTVPKQLYDAVILEKEKLAADLKVASDKAGILEEVKSQVSELKKEFGVTKRWNTIAPLIGVVLGGLITFGIGIYSNKADNSQNKKKLIEQLYGDLVYDFSKYSHNLTEYHKTQIIISWEVAVLEMQMNNAIRINPKIIYDPKIIELKQYNQRRMDEKILNLDEYDAKIRKDFKSLMLYSPKLEALDSIVDRLLYYKCDAAENIGRVRYDSLLNTYNSEQLEDQLGEDLYKNFEVPLGRFLKIVVSFTPELLNK